MSSVRVSQGSLEANQRVFVNIEEAGISVCAGRSCMVLGALLRCTALQGQGFADCDSVMPTRSIDQYLVGDGSAK